MCGRLSRKSQAQVIAALYQAKPPVDGIAPSYNVAPRNKTLIVREGPDHERTLDVAAFGIPTTINGRSFDKFNTKSETAASRADFRDRRCIIPVDGFYEWEDLPPKDPHYIYPPEGLFSLAGVWKQTDKGLAFSILTIAPNPLIAAFHHRMPVILGHNAVGEWLAPAADAQTLATLLQPYPQDLMREHEVSRAVNMKKNDESCIRPLPDVRAG